MHLEDIWAGSAVDVSNSWSLAALNSFAPNQRGFSQELGESLSILADVYPFVFVAHFSIANDINEFCGMTRPFPVALSGQLIR